MNGTSGWQPLKKPRRSSAAPRPNPLAAGFSATPFGRTARTHLLAAAGDGAVAVALAGSIFFSIDPSEARWRVALYLALTVAPFAVVTPLIGPAVDRARGGRRTMIIVTVAARAVVAFFMLRHIDSLLLFPEAFAVLVLQKGYSVSKSAIVPKLVKGPGELIEANSKLALLSAVGGMGGALLAAMLSVIGGSGAAAGLAMIIFAVATLSALQMPKLVVADQPADPEERAELRSANIWLAASAMGILRGIVGFVTFLLAFEFRGGKDGVDLEAEGAAVGAATAAVRGIDVVGDPAAPSWHFGVAVAAAGLGTLTGARLAPALRRTAKEENILLGVLAAAAAGALVAAWSGGLFGAALVALVVGITSSTGKLAFDSLVQRDAPDANYGRSFARFEARFQLTWVAGAAIPVVLTLSDWFGYLLFASAAAFGTFSYFVGSRSAATARIPGPRIPPIPQPLDGAPTVVLPPPDPTMVAGGASDALAPPDPTVVLADPADPLPPPDPTVAAADLPAPGSAEPVGAEAPPPGPPASFAPIVTTVDGVEVIDDLGLLDTTEADDDAIEPSESPEDPPDAIEPSESPEADDDAIEPSESPEDPPDGATDERSSEREEGQLGLWSQD